MVTARQLSGPPEAPGSVRPPAPGAAGDAEGAVGEVEDDILVEDIVIDGMCGVY